MSNLDTIAFDGHLAPPSGAEVAGAEKVVHAIMGGLKNYGVFPPDHASTLMLLQGVQQAIGRFIEKYGDLRVEVAREGMFYRGKPVFKGEASDDNPAFVLQRDGIRRFEFLAGIREQELATFFSVFSHYRVIPDEPEDDLVTALWRADLPHILHEASYELWDNEPVADLALFEPADPCPPGESVAGGGGSGWESIRPDGSGEEYQQMSLGLAEGGQDLWSLTPEEQQALGLMISEDLNCDNSEAAVRLMFLVLRREEEPQIYESIVNYLREEFRSALGDRNFRRAYFILDNLRKMDELLAFDKPWTVGIHNRFQAEIIRPQVLESLVPVWPLLPTLAAADLKTFIAVLQLLPTTVGVSLAGMLPRMDSKQARSLIIEIIASYATRDPGVLEALLGRDEEDLVLRLVRVLRDLPDREVVAQLLHHVKHHPCPKIRQEALRIQGRQELY